MAFLDEFAQLFWQGTITILYGAALAALEIIWNIIYMYGLNPDYAFPGIYDSSWDYAPTSPEVDSAMALHSTVYSEIAIPAVLLIISLHAVFGLFSITAGLRRRLDPVVLPAALSLALARISPFALDVLLDMGRAAYETLWPEVPQDLAIKALFTNASITNTLVMTFFAGYLALVLLGIVFFLMARMAYILVFIPFSPIASVLLAVPATRRLGKLLWRIFIELSLGMVAMEVPLVLAGYVTSNNDFSLFIVLGLATASLAMPLLVHTASSAFLAQFSVSTSPAASSVRAGAMGAAAAPRTIVPSVV
ncbi:MAG: hypothetical protein J7J79_02295 [Thermoplasmata archaeon]|nr:hypothetical protein [Thermoplasmata archaeon]